MKLEKRIYLPARSTSVLEVTVLGSGTSMGVPTLTCHCRVCSSADPHDNRTRASILLAYQGKTAVIDTTPDFQISGAPRGP